jgi:hypothetical protein
MKRNERWCLVGLVCVLALLGLAKPAFATPYFLLETEEEWNQALSDGRVEGLTPPEWQDYMLQWSTYREEGDPYPSNQFLPPELYVYGGGGGGGGGLNPEDAGLVMFWGPEPIPPASYSSAYKYVYDLDPNLTNCTITVTVTPPPWINVVSFGMKDALGRIRAWYWNVGAGGPLPPGVPTTVTIIASQLNITATTPVASAFANNPLFDITQVTSFIFDENSNWVGGIGIPAPGTGLIGSWNYWHNISVLPFQDFVKWAQPPTYSDQSQYPNCYWGWDELSIWEGPQYVADDWPCNDDRPITDVHWWGSYQGWEGPEPPQWAPQRFHIAIWTDVPIGPGNPWSHPGRLLQEWWVPRAQLFERQDGCDFYPPMIGPDTCFRYDFIIPRDQWFYQNPHENNVYWISIAASYLTGIPQNPWGWKTRLPHWNDDAVRVISPLMPAPEVLFQEGIPIETADGSWDMAFVLTTNREEPMPSKPKYEQPPEPVDPPDVFLGWNEESLWEPNGGIGTIAADDWVCSSPDPITKIRWWGSFIGWNYAYTPSTTPNHFHITFWTDVPASVGGFSHPGQVIHEVICTNFTYQWVGWDYNPATGEYESCFLFEQTLTPAEYFYQPTANGVYWISIAACYQPAIPPTQYLFGWKTRPRDPGSPAPDAAVRMWDPRAPVYGSTWVSGEPISWPTPEDSWDLAFELISAPVSQPVSKWIQNPDLSSQGIDVNDTNPPITPVPQYILADDFQCNRVSYLTKIEVWGSWFNDVLPPAGPGDVTFTLSLHADIPANPPSIPYSRPGNVLWTRTYAPGQFAFSMYQTTTEGWMDPPSGYIFPGDHQCWLYSFNIPAGEFRQQGTPTIPIIYWVDVQATPGGSTALFGWKTTTTHSIDKAVYGQGVEPFLGPWYELFYPPGHPQVGTRMDLAFRITDQQGVKWTRLPDLSTNGVDINATYRQQAKQYLLADDFPCHQTGPLTRITVFGSWLNDYLPPGGAGNPTFTLSIHSDLPVGHPQNPYGYSIPGAMLKMWTFEPGTYIAEPFATTEEGWLNPPSDYTFPADFTCWRYTFDLPTSDPFVQQGTPTNPIIYWLDVQANVPDQTARFGWKTSPFHWNDDAVWANATEAVPVPGPWTDLRYPWTPNESIDLAFIIEGRPQPQEPYTKWSQPPEPYTPDDGYNGWNEMSVYNWYQIVADDWPCTTEYPVTDLHWWGSFINWPYKVAPQLPDRFHIGIWTDVPANPPAEPFSHPGVMLWEVWCDNFTYEFVGWDWDPRILGRQNPNPPEACFRFDQVLDRAEWFFQDPGENIYWISIAAVYDSGAYPDYPWGWKTRPHLFMDDGVMIYDPTAPVPGSGYVNGWPIEYPWGVSWDLAFTLTTLDCDLLGDMNMDGLINGMDIQCFVHCLIDGFPACTANCNCACADMDQDGFLTLADIGPFVSALLGP